MVKTFDDMQKTSDANVDATVHSLEGVTKVTQAIAGEITDYTKRSFESGTKTMENLLGARSLDKAFEVQSEYARAAYELRLACITTLRGVPSTVSSACTHSLTPS